MLPLRPPLPLAATIEGATGNVEVEFDHVLRPGPLSHLNWALKANRGPGNLVHIPQPGALAVDRFVRFATIPGGMAFPPFGISYFPFPPDVFSWAGLPAAQFNDFPIVKI